MMLLWHLTLYEMLGTSNLVALPRATRRVVVLFKKNVSTRMKFFESLDAKFEKSESSVVLLDFDKEKPPEMWFKRGFELFQRTNYRLAASFFNVANNFGWSGWA